MIRGTIIGTIGVTLTFMFNNVWFTIIGTMIFSIGEMAASPTLSAFIAQITPKGKEALYQGTYFLPVAVGNYIAGLFFGGLYEKWSDKYQLLQTEMANRAIEMPANLTKSEYFALASEKLGLNQQQITALRAAISGLNVVDKRYKESLKNFEKILKEFDNVVVYDNSVRFRTLLRIIDKKVIKIADDLPEWMENTINNNYKKHIGIELADMPDSAD